MALDLPTNLKAFKYKALNYSTRSIRLLKVEKYVASDLHPIQCHLETYEIDACPPFIALSYTWGYPYTYQHILLDNKSFPVRENLYSALVTLSILPPPQPPPVNGWLDDITERSLEQLRTEVIGFNSATDPLKEALGQELWNAVLSSLKPLDGWKNGYWNQSDLERVRSAVRSSIRKHERSLYEKSWPPNFDASPLLYSALERPYYWIDAICINQANPSEQGHQVNMMGRIYSQAAGVFTWLGLASEEMDLAMKSINVPEHLREPSGSRDITEKTRVELETNPYWERMWIIQEFTLAREIIILCGRNKTRWEKLEEACRFRYLRPTLIWPLIDVRDRWHGRLTSAFLDIDTSLDILIERFGSRQCSNVRDRVYALLSMVRNQPDASKPLYPDYNISPKQLYIRVLGYVRHIPSLSDTIAWEQFRTSLRHALGIPLDRGFRKIELLYNVTERDRPHRKPLLQLHPDHRIQLNHTMLKTLASFFMESFDDETWDPQHRYTKMTKLFEEFPKEEDPQAWETFDNALKDALGLDFTSLDTGDTELWETFMN